VTGLLTTFNFEVTILLGDGSIDPLCRAAFSECDGLEVSLDVVTVREGGNNNGPIHLVGPASYGTLALKRGMTDTVDLWNWVELVLRDGERHRRATCEVAMLGSDRRGPVATFVLTGCLPVRLKAPALSGLDGGIAIEELDVAYQTLALKPGTSGERSRA
jgi:phage tail-like protein